MAAIRLAGCCGSPSRTARAGTSPTHDTLRELEEEGRVVFRYSTEDGQVTPDSNPNGSVNNIAGIVNARGNVLGMMPHPERCCEQVVGGADGSLIFNSIIDHLAS